RYRGRKISVTTAHGRGGVPGNRGTEKSETAAITGATDSCMLLVCTWHDSTVNIQLGHSMRAPPMRNLSFVIAFALAQISLASAQDKSIVVPSPTSTHPPSLFRPILPLFIH